MKKQILKAAVCIALVVPTCALGLGASASPKTEEQKTSDAALLSNIINNAADADKDETVYVIAGADGSPQKVIVSDWIKNRDKAPQIKDKTQLENIEVTKGDCSYTISGDEKVWDTKSEDVYYKGTTDKALPVDVKLTYTLDGKNISASEIAGKSGHIKLRFDFTNNQYETVSIDGKDEKIYVPFAVLSGLILDNDKFSNIEMTNGKIINDGSRYIAAGYALPGMQESLGLNSKDMELPSYVELTADTTDFELPTTLTLVTNEVWNGIDKSKLDSVDSLKDQLSQLNSGALSLVNGTAELSKNLTLLADQLPGIVDKITSGVNDLENGAGTIDDNMNTLTDKLSEMQSGLGALSGNSATVNAGAKQVFESLLFSANNSLASAGMSVPQLTIDNYNQVLSGVIASLPDAAPYAQAKAQLQALKGQLDSYSAFYAGLSQYTSGVDGAYAGSQQLYAGSQQLTAGMDQLKGGIDEFGQATAALSQGDDSLTSSVSKLADGAKQIMDGTQKFYDEGISKITSLVGDDAINVVVRFRAMLDVSDDYTSFGGISDNMSGAVKFIYRTAAVESKK